MNDLVSVIVPTYSRPINLLRAISSVENQTYKNIEIIVVDDNGIGSLEQLETERVLSNYIKDNRIVYYPHEFNKNGSAARNTGLKLANGKYIAFLDDDDEYLREKIELQVMALKSLDETWGGCYSNTNLIGKRNIVLNNNKSGNLAEDLLLGKIRFNTSSLLLRKEVCDILNGFDESFTRHQDWEFMMRFFRLYKLYLPTTSVLLNKYSSRSSSSNFPRADKFIEIKHKFLDTFSDDIKKFNTSGEIYHEHWMQVVSSLLYEHKYTLFFQYLKLANSFSSFTLSDFKSLVFSAFLSFFK